MDYKELKELLIRANDAYYKESNPIMSDLEFDLKLKELEKLEAEQGYADPDSPTQKPGSDLSSSVNTENLHGRPMLSLGNTYSKEEVAKWYSDMQMATGSQNPEVVVNMKWDGGSGALRYINGQLVKALTRGNGTEGEDITQNIKYCDDNIWTQKVSRMGLSVMPFTGEARGEIIMTKDGFTELNKDGKYQNARNLVSGSLKLLDIYQFIPRAASIKFYAYWLEDSQNSTYAADLEELKRFGFTVGEYYVCRSLDEILEAISKIENSTYDVEIDGAVMKLNEKKYWAEIGSTAKYPRWAKAYKYKQQTAETTVKNVTFEVGRSGKITPLCWFEPVFLDGSTIQKATLNNKEFYEAMDIAVGDTIEVQKAAAIIPQIVSVTFRPTDRKVVPFPKVCPSCDSKLIKHNDEHADWYCDNSDCSSRIIDQIINYTHMLEIDGFAEIVVEKLHSAGLLNSIPDLYKLKDHKTEIAELDRLSLNMAEKLCKNIEDSKGNNFWKLLAGLGIPNVGPKTAKILAKRFKTMKVLESVSYEDLIFVEDIADITANGIIKYFSTHKKLIQELTDAGVSMSDPEAIEEEKPTIDLNGKTFCITGALSLTRDIYVNLIETCGGKVVNSVTKKTSYLITNDKTTGTKKNLAAQELGIPILNEKELLELCDALSLLKEIS